MFTQAISYSQKSVSSCTTSCVYRMAPLCGPTKSAGTSVRTSSCRLTSQQSHTSHGHRGTFQYCPEYMTRFAASSNTRSTPACTNHQTHPINLGGSASSRRTASCSASCSLKPLNQVTIKHSGVTPFTDQIGKHFAGHVCGGMLDLYVGYDKRGLSEGLRNLTTFQSPFDAL